MERKGMAPSETHQRRGGRQEARLKDTRGQFCTAGSWDGEEMKLARWAEVSLKDLERHEKKFELLLMSSGEPLTVLKQGVMGSNIYFRDKTDIGVKGGMERVGWWAVGGQGKLKV